MKEKIIEILNEFAESVHTISGHSIPCIHESDFETVADKICEIDNWLSVEIKPEHNQQCLCYTPHSDITKEEYRLLRFGTQLNGFPIGVTHWQPLPSKPKNN